jgi:hypothetical protein
MKKFLVVCGAIAGGACLAYLTIRTDLASAGQAQMIRRRAFPVPGSDADEATRC